MDVLEYLLGFISEWTVPKDSDWDMKSQELSIDIMYVGRPNT